MIYHYTGAAFWSTPGTRIAPGVWEPNSSLVVLVGWNIEIVFMFFMMGIVSTKMFKGTIQEELAIENLEEQKAYRKKRITKSTSNGFLDDSVMYYCRNNTKFDWIIDLGVGWNCRLPNIWSKTNPILIYLIGYLHFWTISAIVYDCKRRWVQFTIVGGMAVLTFGTFITLGAIGWLAPVPLFG